jgi:beta-galactosidase
LVHVDVVDDKGNVVPDADNLINFSISGDGKLIGLDNGNPRDDTSFKLNSRKAFNGHAYAVIQAGRKAGDMVLTVQGDGLKPASVTIKAQQPASAVMTFEDFK